jgi:quercetin dioxygenase-like cupin family protein
MVQLTDAPCRPDATFRTIEPASTATPQGRAMSASAPVPADSSPPAVPAAPLLRDPSAAPVLELMGTRIRFLVSTEETGGAWSLLGYTAPAGFAGPAPHFHARTTELFYVLEGRLTLEAGGAAQVLDPGGLALVPPGVPHRFGNPSAEPCRFLIQLSPGGMEGYFTELAGLVRGAPAWPLPDMRPVAELAARFDTFSPPAPRESGSTSNDRP